MAQYTSFELSKKLWDNGCRRLIPKMYWTSKKEQCNYNSSWTMFNSFNGICYPSYDILWDICIQSPKEFFGEELQVFDNDNGYIYAERADIAHPKRIFEMILEGVEQEVVEQYIWENCKFNPLNKIRKFRYNELIQDVLDEVK
jgi:hypothetical protein